jgi:hypothetical protein
MTQLAKTSTQAIKQDLDELLLVLCHDGKERELLCRDVAHSPRLNYSEDQCRVISSGDNEQVQHALRESKPSNSLWVIATDKPLPNAIKREYFRGLNSAIGLVFVCLEDDRGDNLVERMLDEILKRRELLFDLKVSAQQTKSWTKRVDLNYPDLAKELAHSCRRHLQIDIGEQLSQSSTKYRLQLCQSMIALLKPPLEGYPVAGSVDVNVCLELARNAYQASNSTDQPLPIAQNGRISNTDWESLFTLCYASFVYSGATDISISETTIDSVGSLIAVTFKKNKDDRSTTIKDPELIGCFEKLIENSKHSGFWMGYNQPDDLVILLMPFPCKR